MHADHAPSMGTAGLAPALERTTPRLVAHVIHAFRVGGLENGLVNLINRMDPGRYRHAIVCMTDYAAEFRDRVERPDVRVLALHKERLSRWGIYRALHERFREWRPTIVHGRNWDGLDAMLPAFLAGVRVRIQGEHGRDMHDLDGSNRKQRWLRRINRPFTQHYTTVSVDLQRYLVDAVGIGPRHVTQIYNGVDTVKYRPAAQGRCALPDAGAVDHDAFVIGTVGRLVPVKDQSTLVRAFARAVRTRADPGRLRLVIVGDGPLRSALQSEAAAEGVAAQVFFAGARNDVPAWLRAMDLFVLPSLGEGISNTVLEAMACGLPVVATRVGGNVELIDDGRTGHLFDVGDCEALAACIVRYASDASYRSTHARAARIRAERRFSIDAMIQGYTDLYDALCARHAASLPAAGRPGRV